MRGKFRNRALEEGPYGCCVYRCDNEAVDHQVVAIKFEDGSPIGHCGGDEGLLRHFCGALAGGGADQGGTSGRVSLESHLIGFAAERARLGSEVVEMASFRQAVRSAAAS